jgi:hypothetical protein
MSLDGRPQSIPKSIEGTGVSERPASTPGQALMISGDVPTDTYTVSSVAVLRDGTVVLQVARKDAQDG